MGACAQIAVFTYAVMRRTPRYEIRLAAPFADNLMNSVAHCGCHLPPGEEGYGAVSLTPCLVGQAYYCPESAFRNPGSIFMEESMKTF